MTGPIGTPSVRLAGPGELAAALAVRMRVFVDEQAVPLELERDEHDATADHALAVVGDRVVGTGRLVASGGTGGGTGVVGRMAVLAEARGGGVGAAVLAALEDRARERGLAVLELHAQTHARGFYERAGYQAYGDEFDEAGIRHVAMRKVLREVPGKVPGKVPRKVSGKVPRKLPREVPRNAPAE